MDEGVKILELARSACRLFSKQKSGEKRRLLNFVLSNCSWKNGELSAEFKQPFDLFVDANRAHRKKMATSTTSSDFRKDWLPDLDSNQEPSG